MILFHTLTIKQVQAFTKAELNRENTKTLLRLRKWCTEQMTKISKVVDENEPSPTTEKLDNDKKGLNNIRIIIDQINGVSSEKIASRNTGLIKEG